jgi:TIR domain
MPDNSRPPLPPKQLRLHNQAASIRQSLTKLKSIQDDEDDLNGDKTLDWGTKACTLIARICGKDSSQFTTLNRLLVNFNKVKTNLNLEGFPIFYLGKNEYHRNATKALSEVHDSLIIKLRELGIPKNYFRTKDELDKWSKAGGKVLPPWPKEDIIPTPMPTPVPAPKNKVFVSHAHSDKDIVQELVAILELIGLRHNQIFCTAVPGYGIPLGDNLFERLKAELNDNAAVIFVLSDNFYNRPICLAEMGAAWVLSSSHAPVIVPPFKYNQIEGVIKNTIAITINNADDLNLLAEWVAKEFGITIASGSRWEHNRARILGQINGLIKDRITAKESEAK